MTHYEYTRQHKPATPCTAARLTFGGRCLNCGFDPEESRRAMFNEAKEIDARYALNHDRTERRAAFVALWAKHDLDPATMPEPPTTEAGL